MKKNIWLISKYFSPRTENTLGGRDWFLVNEMAQKGHNITVITSDSNSIFDVPKIDSRLRIDKYENFSICWLKTLKYKTPKSLLRIIGWFHFELNLFFLNKKKFNKPDAIIVSSLSLLTILNGLILKKKYKCKLIFEIRDIWPLTIIEEGGFSKYNPFVIALSFIEYIGYKYSDAIVGTMPNLSEHIENIIGYKKNVKCIPMGFHESMLKKEDKIDEEYLSKYLNSDYFNVVHAGTIGITNALNTFFKTAELMRDNKSIKFVLIGDGALKKTYQEQYSHFENVIFAPKVPRKMVASVLQKANIVYFSTFNSKVWDYGQSLNKVVDYMLSGKLILASYSGYPSMINEAECGYFLPANNTEALAKKIEELQNQGKLEVDKIGEKGRNWIIKNRNYTKLADDYLDFIFDEI
ncbi:glycosyltransferase family 4 protein [Xenorhabdus bovienii]|uniref:glycosyltransferase family 4 protein n=1 Tax=Xenorhabdus bovienii TaxID=40576 RepID=UPI003DA33B91